MHVGGTGSSKGRTSATMLHCGVFRPRFEARLRSLADIGGILTIDHPARDDRARHHSSAVAPARTDIEHLHARDERR